ncbi:AlpA family transcriptional regulator [uncultured Modestobacter sp.]|uniref:helix-turn-helix transcriptional regulator n=1 Tax=uncultured Modestobacter sp. TaxID=380048 RepID=UPI0026272DC3|nr:helix-turn-helix domain-containing protein [uncultured Modestobacter sp.]
MTQIVMKDPPAPPTVQSGSTWETEQAVADRLGVHIETLRKYRRSGTGPRFSRLPGGQIRYRSTTVDAWLERAAEGGAA